MQDNKLIAEFMGVSVNIPQYIPNYHTSWDWLMPVLSKILDITFSDDEKETSDSEYFYNIRDCVPDINHTYKAIIEFIKTYNDER
mgnify:CR=1 FL=1|tara:strand:- start:207 stop:461 length:255 start_codon:yes stop_codon:yes gene_type:complete